MHHSIPVLGIGAIPSCLFMRSFNDELPEYNGRGEEDAASSALFTETVWPRVGLELWTQGALPTSPFVTRRRRCGQMRGRGPGKNGGVFAGIHRGFFRAENDADGRGSFPAVERSMSDRLPPIGHKPYRRHN